MAHHAVAAPALLLIHAAQGGGKAVRERTQVRIVALSADPQAVKQLQFAVGRRRDEVGHLHGKPALARIIGDRAAHEEDFVVRMGRNDQQIGLFKRRLPLLNPVRRFALAKDVRLREDEPVAVSLRAHDDLLRPLGQLRVAGQVVRIARGDRRPYAAPVARLHLKRAGAVVELDVHAADGLPLRRGDFKSCAVAARGRPARSVIAIREASKRRGARRAHRARRRDVLRGLRTSRARRNQQRAHEQQQTKFLHPMCSPLFLWVYYTIGRQFSQSRKSIAPGRLHKSSHGREARKRAEARNLPPVAKYNAAHCLVVALEKTQAMANEK